MLSKILTLFILIACGPVTFPSGESRTALNQIVYNKVSFFHENGSDVWKMRQSHDGPHLSADKWDELMIVVKDKRARFYQFQNGKEIEFKVSCFNCHTNGPRAIRPDATADISMSDKVQIGLMNLRIKTYGRLKDSSYGKRKIPFRHEGKISNATLNLPACTKCHSEDGFLSRGSLTRQNGVTIDFMVKNGHMPPLGTLTDVEKRYIQDFIDGF